MLKINEQKELLKYIVKRLYFKKRRNKEKMP